jgi:regulator of sigma E protease
MAAGFLRDIIAGVLVLSILVLLHELGHFIAAKLCGVRVDVFSIGFPPKIWSVKYGDTEYRISALLFGGYVKMAGENPIEERSGAGNEFLSKTRWQRFFIAVAGPVMNILVTFVIFWGIYTFAGMPTDAYLQHPADVAAVPQSYSSATEVQAGDRIISVDHVPTPTWGRVVSVLEKVEKSRPGAPIQVTVLRNGATQTLTAKLPAQPVAADAVLGYPLVPAAIDEVEPGSPAQKGGLQAGDVVESINGEPVVTWLQLVEHVRGSNGRLIKFVVKRDGKDVPIEISPIHTMTADGDTAWQIGAGVHSDETYEHQGIFTAAKDGAEETFLYARLIGQIFAGLFHGSVSVRDLAGPVGIVQMSGQAAKNGPVSFLNWMAYISLDLALINLIPIPIFDGGLILMLAVEGTLKRDLSIGFKERLIQVGLVLILGLFAFVMYNDILRIVSQVHWH